MKYTIDDARRVVELIEATLAASGFHSAIGGSLAYRGTSNKDIDIILYNHSREVVIDRGKIVNLLETLGFVAANENLGTQVPDVYKALSPDGHSVDFFFMQRSDFAANSIDFTPRN